MDSTWSDVFYDKLISNKLVTCSLAFKKSRLRQKNSRKRNTSLFQCYGRCQRSECPVTVRIAMVKNATSRENVIFRVRITGVQYHDNSSICTGRRLKGIKRLQMGNSLD